MHDEGFTIIEGVFTAAECDALTVAIASGGEPRRKSAGARHLMSNPHVAALAHDARLLRLAADALGGTAIPYRATLFEKTGRANWLVVWHQDTALPLVAQVASSEWGPWSTKAGVLYAHAPAWALERIVALRVHLDASTADNGPLRVIPGSHRLGVLSDDQVFATAHAELSPFAPQKGANVLSTERKTTIVDCCVARGGVLAMRPLLIHSSSKAQVDQPRRVLHIEYANSLDLGPGLRLAVA